MARDEREPGSRPRRPRLRSRAPARRHLPSPRPSRRPPRRRRSNPRRPAGGDADAGREQHAHADGRGDAHAAPDADAARDPHAGVAAATPPPAASGPSPAQQAAGLIGQAEAALGGRQYDIAIAHLDGALRLDPGNAKATSLRADATQRRDLARRKFVAGRTVVDSEKTRKDKARGLVGFDADEKAPDFTGRIEFEMSPAGAVEANDAWTLKVFVVNQGQKAIRVQGLALGAAVNGTGGAAPVAASVREIAPQQRVQVAETSGTWKDGTTSWVAQATLTAPKNETLSNTLTWK